MIALLKSRTLGAGALAFAAALTGCSTLSQGMGGGELDVKGKASVPVLFSWTSNDGGISGGMTATLPNATYSGNFLQITHQTQRTDLGPMWNGWNEGWGDWPYWRMADPAPLGPFDATQFTRDYTGKVVANLRDAGGDRMRCRFHMNDPADGMSGGGEGECQLAGGKVVSAVINRR